MNYDLRVTLTYYFVAEATAPVPRARLILARRHGADLLKTAEARVVMHVLDSSRQISKPAAIAGDRSKNTHPQTSITIIFHLYFLSPQ